MVAVGGAVRNKSGHWNIGCHQLDIKYYRLEIRPGYKYQFRDCMACDFLDGPLIIRTSLLQFIDVQIPRSLALIDLAIRKHGAMLACPDVLFFTESSIATESLKASESVWLQLAKVHKFQGLVTLGTATFTRT